jgi:hypothetical protein
LLSEFWGRALSMTDVDAVGHHGLPEQCKEWFKRDYVHYAFRSCEPW